MLLPTKQAVRLFFVLRCNFNESLEKIYLQYVAARDIINTQKGGDPY